MAAKQWMAKGLIFAIIFAILTGCAAPTPTSTPTAAPVPTDIPQPAADLPATMIAVQTQAVKTYIFNMTQNAPTVTPFVPTRTSRATAILMTTITPQKIMASPTAPLDLEPEGPTSTTAVTCQVTQASPSASESLAPGADFSARWVIVNTGTTTWKKSVFSIIYWSGWSFDNQAKLMMPFDVGQKSNITVATGKMKAPSSPGTYKSVWAVVDGFQVYCLMPLTIVTK